MTDSHDKGILDGLRVLEIGHGVSAPYAALNFAKLGAEVVKIEPLEGDPSRTHGPFPDGIKHKEKSALFLAYNHGKKSVCLDLDASHDREKLKSILSHFDLVIENQGLGFFDDRRLGYKKISYINPSLIWVSILPFGEVGPYSKYIADDLVLFHMSGNAHGVIGPVENPDMEPPIRAGGYQAEMVAGITASTAAMVAIHRKLKTGKGCKVVVSGLDSMITMAISGIANSAFGQPPSTRELSKEEGSSIGGMVSAIGGVLKCNDGYVAISPREDSQWERWLELIGNPHWADDERFATRENRQTNVSELWDLLTEWSLPRSKFDIARSGQEKRIPCFPVNTIEDLLVDQHLESREFFVEISHSDAGNLFHPGLPYKLNNANIPQGKSSAPRLGEHTQEILERSTKDG